MLLCEESDKIRTVIGVLSNESVMRTYPDMCPVRILRIYSSSHPYGSISRHTDVHTVWDTMSVHYGGETCIQITVMGV